MSISSIEWTNVTDNVFVVEGEEGKPHGWYCQKVSPGCQHCYAERLNGNSFFNGNGLAYRVMEDVPKLMMRRDVMSSWARMRTPKKHFVNSMTDTFADFYPKAWIYELLDAMVAAPLQTFQVLTKRTERMYDVVARWMLARKLRHVPTNIWLGFSAENQEWFDKRAEWALKIPAILFVSLEPLLGPVDMTSFFIGSLEIDALRGKYGYFGRPQADCEEIDWVIVGGESGSHARPMHPDWVRDIQEQCVEAGVPFFFKQWGSNPGEAAYGSVPLVNAVMQEKKGGRLLDGVEWNQFPEVHHAD